MATFSRDFDVKSDSERLRVTIDGPTEDVAPRVLSLHGAGPANRTRMNYLAAHLAKTGWGTMRFDFSGHGDSSGTMGASSLAKRIREASLIAAYLDGASAPVLIGTSMGGHVAARLCTVLRPSHLFLFCPAAYGQATENITFGPAFTEAIRQPESYVGSLAYRALAQYDGRLTIIIGAQDEIIPRGVIDGYMTAAQRARNVRLERIADAPHQIHGWASKNPAVEHFILSVLDDELRR